MMASGFETAFSALEQHVPLHPFFLEESNIKVIVSCSKCKKRQRNLHGPEREETKCRDCQKQIQKSSAVDQNPFATQRRLVASTTATTEQIQGLASAAESPVWFCVFATHATREVKLHAIYVVLFLGLNYRLVGLLFGKSKSTIGNWVKQYNEEGDLKRRTYLYGPTQKIFEPQADWIENYVLKVNPLVYLHELKAEFLAHWKFSISLSTLARVLHQRKITKQVIERRALDIRFSDILRYEGELNSFYPLFEQIVFLDEMSTDNRSMLRKRGWFLQNKRPFFRGIFRRGKRHSILAFLGVEGLFEVFATDGTFDRLAFFACIKELLVSGKVQPYPGRHSVWIMDGASIHLDTNMIDYLWLAGLYVIFLPAYCPFFNPIEIMFGMVKRECQAQMDERKKMDDELILAFSLRKFASYDFTAMFEACGYTTSGRFDRNVNLDHFLLLRGDMEEVAE
jgi:transposase